MGNLSQWQKATPLMASPFHRTFISLQNELDKIFKDFYRLLDFPSVSSEAITKLSISPSIDIVEDDKYFKIESEMPGIGQEDIKVSINKKILTIKGEKKTSKKDENKNYLMREISYGCYERSITLPDDVDINQAKASFRKGMLWVTIPKKPGAANQLKELKIEKA